MSLNNSTANDIFYNYSIDFKVKHFTCKFSGAPSDSVSGVVAKKDDKNENEKEKTSSSSRNMLVVSGGEGYIDFRLGDFNNFY